MHEPKGGSVAITAPRRFLIDLLHFAKRVPTVPVARTVDVSALRRARADHPLKPSWSILFMKAFALVAADHPPLRRALLTFPWLKLYEHPQSTCAWRWSGRISTRKGSSSACSGRRSAIDRAAPGGARFLQERAARKRRLLPPGDPLRPGADADPKVPVVVDAERLRVQAGQAVRDVRTVELRGIRRREPAPDLALDDDDDLWADRPLGEGRREADLRPPGPRRRLHRPTAPGHRVDSQRLDPRSPELRLGRASRRLSRARPISTALTRRFPGRVVTRTSMPLRSCLSRASL